PPSPLSLPDEPLDGPPIDGGSQAGILLRLGVADLGPVMAVLALLTLGGQWDNLIWPLLVVQSAELKTMPLYVVTFMEEKATNEGAMVAVAAISSIPMLIIFFTLSQYFLRGANVFSAG